MVTSTVSLQAISGIPKKFHREVTYRNARIKGKRICEKRTRRSAQSEIDDQLAQMKPSKTEEKLAVEAMRLDAEAAVEIITEQYREALTVARQVRDAAINALPPELRQFVEEDGYEGYYSYYYVR